MNTENYHNLVKLKCSIILSQFCTNFVFPQPQLAQAQTFTKLVGLPFQSSLFSTNGHLYTSANPSQSSFDETSRKLVSNEEEKQKDFSEFLLPPQHGTQFTSLITGAVAKTDVVHEKGIS